MKRLLGRLLLVVFGLLIGTLAAEMLSRMVRPDASADLLFGSPESSPMGLYVVDHDTLLTPRPGFTGAIRSPGYRVDLRINEVGLRGPPAAEVSGTQWLAVGDSFTMSVQALTVARQFSGRLSSVPSCSQVVRRKPSERERVPRHRLSAAAWWIAGQLSRQLARICASLHVVLT